jgi:NADH:ubiquinone oxidoreductase subunit E
MDQPTTLTICLGSSCFTRGNDENLPRIQAFLQEKGLAERVRLRGSRCEGRCQHGPNLKVDAEFLPEVRPGTLLEELERRL